MSDAVLQTAVETVPPGNWAVGVSGGADSVALLALLRGRADVSLHVVHLDHEARAAESSQDAEFVADLCSRWQLPVTVARRRDIEPERPGLPTNPSARFRQLRRALFQRVVTEHGLSGVILAHHADDQAETVLQRLLRAPGPMGLAGMSPRARIGGLLILRPMVGVRRDVLRQLLAERKLSWREDSSNRSPKFLRNRLRDLLQDNEQLTVALLDLSARCRDLRDWARRTAPVMAEQFPAVSLARLPSILATESAKQWLADRGVPLSRLDPPTITRLVEMAVDAATPSRQQFAGGITIARRAGIISAHGSRE